MTNVNVIEEVFFVPYNLLRLKSFTVSVCLLDIGES